MPVGLGGSPLVADRIGDYASRAPTESAIAERQRSTASFTSPGGTPIRRQASIPPAELAWEVSPPLGAANQGRLAVPSGRWQPLLPRVPTGPTRLWFINTN